MKETMEGLVSCRQRHSVLNPPALFTSFPIFRHWSCVMSVSDARWWWCAERKWQQLSWAGEKSQLHWCLLPHTHGCICRCTGMLWNKWLQQWFFFIDCFCWLSFKLNHQIVFRLVFLDTVYIMATSTGLLMGMITAEMYVGGRTSDQQILLLVTTALALTDPMKSMNQYYYWP